MFALILLAFFSTNVPFISRAHLPGAVATIHDDAERYMLSEEHIRRKIYTYSLPVQKELASLASQVATPRNSSGRPRRPIGFSLAHFSNRLGCASKYVAVNLKWPFEAFQCLPREQYQKRTLCRYILDSGYSHGFF